MFATKTYPWHLASLQQYWNHFLDRTPLNTVCKKSAGSVKAAEQVLYLEEEREREKKAKLGLKSWLALFRGAKL